MSSLKSDQSCGILDGEYNITVPAGYFTDCYQLAYWTLPDDSHVGFCPGTGMVSFKYHHHGSVQDEDWRLESFEQTNTLDERGW